MKYLKNKRKASADAEAFVMELRRIADKPSEIADKQKKTADKPPKIADKSSKQRIHVLIWLGTERTRIKMRQFLVKATCFSQRAGHGLPKRSVSEQPG